MNEMSGNTRAVARLGAQVGAALIGHELLVERLLIALLTGGHVLIEGSPRPAPSRRWRRICRAAMRASSARPTCCHPI